MKTVTLPSGQTCRPRRLRSSYARRAEWNAYSESYGLAARLGGTAKELWKANPWIVSSVNPSDLAIYNPKKHPKA